MRRRFDLSALFAGVLFAVVGLLFVLDQTGHIRLELGVLWPIGLIVIGMGTVADGALSARRTDTSGPSGPSGPSER